MKVYFPSMLIEQTSTQLLLFCKVRLGPQAQRKICCIYARLAFNRNCEENIENSNLYSAALVVVEKRRDSLTYKMCQLAALELFFHNI